MTGVVSTGDSDVIVIDAVIERTGSIAIGIHSQGANVDIDVLEGGKIDVDGVQAFGIASQGAGADITVDGMVLADGAQTRGIAFFQPGAVVRVRAGGLVESRGRISNAIFGDGPDADITVDGTIRTVGRETVGILASSVARGDQEGETSTTIRVGRSGRVETDGMFTTGISSDDPNAMITVDGVIQTMQSMSPGIHTVGANDEVRIGGGGVIQTEGSTDSNGIRFSGRDTTIRVDGAIRTTGTNSHGIWSQDSRLSAAHRTGANARIHVGRGGMIRTEGADATGIRSGGAGAVITVDGTIRTTGMNAHGIDATVGGATITVSGGIHATGEGALAIRSREGGLTLHLQRGWSITGAIDLDPTGVNNLEIDSGDSGMSRMLHILNLNDDDNVDIMGDGLWMMSTVPDNDETIYSFITLARLDPSASAMHRATLANLSRAVHGAVHGRDVLSRPVPGGAKGGGFDNRRIWGAVIGGDFERGADGAALGWDGHLRGVVAGMEGRLGNGIRVGVLGGYARSDAATGPASIDTDIDTVMLGVYGETGGDVEGGGRWTLAGTLVGGWSDLKTIRLVEGNAAGLQKASGSSDGTFASPSVGLMLVHPVRDKYEIRPSLRVDGMYARHDSYTESGAGMANMAYDSWTSSSVDGRAQLGVAFLFGASGEFEVRAGATSRLHGSDEVTVRPAGGGDRMTYDVPGDDNITGGFVGGRLVWAVGDGVSLMADGEYARASDDGRALTGRLKLAASF